MDIRTRLALPSNTNSRHPNKAKSVISTSYTNPPNVMAPKAIIKPITCLLYTSMFNNYSHINNKTVLTFVAFFKRNYTGLIDTSYFF